MAVNTLLAGVAMFGALGIFLLTPSAYRLLLEYPARVIIKFARKLIRECIVMHCVALQLMLRTSSQQVPLSNVPCMYSAKGHMDTCLLQYSGLVCKPSATEQGYL